MDFPMKSKGLRAFERLLDSLQDVLRFFRMPSRGLEYVGKLCFRLALGRSSQTSGEKSC